MSERQPPWGPPELAAPVPREETPDTRGDRLAGVLATLEQGIASVLSDEGFAAYLRMLSRFHEYSYANTLLIMTQRPDATRVNSYARWQALGRQVAKGEHAIKIFYPKQQRVEDPDTGERGITITGFGVGNVFDITQTEGEPLPPSPAIEAGDTSDGRANHLNLALSRWLVDEGLRLESTAFPGKARGFYLPTGNPRAIVVRRDEEGDPLGVGKTKTLVHEAAHYVADHAPTLARGDAETVAESSAFVVMDRFGLDTGAYSFPYVAAWAQNTDVLKRNLGEIQRVSHTLITAIEGVTDPDETERAPARVPEGDQRLAVREQFEGRVDTYTTDL